MQVASVGSGSQGNGTLIATGDTLLIVDCGFSLTQLTSRMEALERAPSQINGILVTHEHTDHIRGVAALAGRYGLPVFLTRGSAQALPADSRLDIHLITPDIPFRIAELDITPVSVPHDASEPVQYLFSSEGSTLGILTDLGHISSRVKTQFSRCDHLLLEFNYDPDLLAEGPYPPALKSRINGQFGHLSNEQATGLLRHADLDRLQQLIVGHISQKNNDILLVAECLNKELRGFDVVVRYASQDTGFDWIDC